MYDFYQKIYWGYYYIAEKIENRNYNCIKCFVKKSCFCKKNAQKTFILDKNMYNSRGRQERERN